MITNYFSKLSREEREQISLRNHQEGRIRNEARAALQVADEDGEPVVVPNDIEEEENVGIVTEEIEAAPEITNENLESNTFIVAVGEHDGGGLNTDLSDSDSSGSDDDSSTDEPAPQVVGAATAALTKRARVSNTMLGSVKGGKYSKRK